MSRTPIAMWDTPLVTIVIPSFALLFATRAVEKSSYRGDPAGMGHNLSVFTLRSASGSLSRTRERVRVRVCQGSRSTIGTKDPLAEGPLPEPAGAGVLGGTG